MKGRSPKGVTFAKTQFERAYSSPGSALVLYRATGAAPSESADAITALEAAATAADTAMAGLDDDQQLVRSSDVVPMLEGPALRMLDCETWSALEAWLTAAAEHLAADGWSGKLTPTIPTVHRKFDNEVFVTPGLMCLLNTVALPEPLDPSESMQGRRFWWAVDLETTDTVLKPVLEWALRGGTAVIVAIGAVQFAMEPAAVVPFVTGVLTPTFNQSVRVMCYEGDHRMRQMTANAAGALSVLEYDESGHDRDMLDTLINLATVTAPCTKTAWIKRVRTFDADRRRNLGHVAPRAPYFEDRRAVWTRFLDQESDGVYDAFVAQILGPGHLNRLELPQSRWRQARLLGGRHLVTHRQPDLWLDGGPPNSEVRHSTARRSTVDPHVLAQARSDFAPILLG